MKAIANGPPMLELYNGDQHIPTDFCSKEVAQIVRVAVPSTDDYRNLRDIWRESGLAVLSGTSSNDKENLFVGVLFWDGPEEQSKPANVFDRLASVGEVSSFVVQTDRISLL